MLRLLAILTLIPSLTLSSASNDHELGWLVGCWVAPDNSAQEVWVAENNRSLAGFGVAIDDSRVVFYEVLSIRPSDDGSWIYSAHPSGQNPTSFAASKISKNSAVFANPDHDYPQEIRYTRDGDRLDATISLLGGANPNTFGKVACE